MVLLKSFPLLGFLIFVLGSFVGTILVSKEIEHVLVLFLTDYFETHHEFVYIF